LPDPQQGWSLLRAIRQAHPASELPIITISVLDERDKGLALGATEYLVKPFEPSKLVALLQRRPGGEVLVVDDEAMILRLMRTILEKSGYRVQGVSNGQAALLSLNRSAPDLIILGLMMPELDGFEVLARVRAHPAGRDLPVLVMTAKHLDRAERQKLKRFGAFLLTKSEYTTVRLLAAVERALRERWATSLSTGSLNSPRSISQTL
jgi:CheY-like chemotaxis protein